MMNSWQNEYDERANVNIEFHCSRYYVIIRPLGNGVILHILQEEPASQIIKTIKYDMLIDVHNIV